MGLHQVHATQDSPARDKVSVFRSLFRGREDVYPRRFESRKTGKSGYSPACASEWVRGVCEKPRVKCAECHHRRFLPVTDDIIRWHLSGHDDAGQSFVAGVYPMLQDESCFFLAIDFDKQDWQQDVSAFLDTCREVTLPVALERSRSGRNVAPPDRRPRRHRPLAATPRRPPVVHPRRPRSSPSRRTRRLRVSGMRVGPPPWRSERTVELAEGGAVSSRLS
jgi:hypothetical protein